MPYEPLKNERHTVPEYKFAGDTERLEQCVYVGCTAGTNALFCDEHEPPIDGNTTGAAVNFPDGNPKTYYGVVKPSTFDLPPHGLLAVGETMRQGAVKYGHLNWREDRVTASVYANAIMRHYLAWCNGEDATYETLPTGESVTVDHLAAIAACAMILIDARKMEMLNDDRAPESHQTTTPR